jgi:hypothetical protein
MAGFTNTLENALLDHIFSVASYTAPVIWVGLWTTAPTDTSTAGESTGTDYTRVKSTTWAAGSSGQTANSTAIAFPTAGASWGTIEYFAVCTSSLAGDMIMYSSLTTSKTVALGDSLTFSSGSLVVTLD